MRIQTATYRDSTPWATLARRSVRQQRKALAAGNRDLAAIFATETARLIDRHLQVVAR